MNNVYLQYGLHTLLIHLVSISCSFNKLQISKSDSFGSTKMEVPSAKSLPVTT